MRFILTLGKAGDALNTAALPDGFAATEVLADKAYDSNAFRQLVAKSVLKRQSP